jgi:hypothetical protein
MTEDRISQRLAQLRAELARGEQAVAELDQQRQALVETLMRISGAIQVLEELQAAEDEAGDGQDET